MDTALLGTLNQLKVVKKMKIDDKLKKDFPYLYEVENWIDSVEVKQFDPIMGMYMTATRIQRSMRNTTNIRILVCDNTLTPISKLDQTIVVDGRIISVGMSVLDYLISYSDDTIKSIKYIMVLIQSGQTGMWRAVIYKVKDHGAILKEIAQEREIRGEQNGCV